MISLARVVLAWAWRRFSPTALIVGFAGLIVLMQGILRLESFRTVRVSIHRSAADLWDGEPKTRSVDPDRDLAARREILLSSHHEYPTVESSLGESSDLRWNDGSSALSAADRPVFDEPIHVDASRLADLSTPAPPLHFP